MHNFTVNRDTVWIPLAPRSVEVGWWSIQAFAAGFRFRVGSAGVAEARAQSRPSKCRVVTGFFAAAGAEEGVMLHANLQNEEGLENFRYFDTAEFLTNLPESFGSFLVRTSKAYFFLAGFGFERSNLDVKVIASVGDLQDFGPGEAVNTKVLAVDLYAAGGNSHLDITVLGILKTKEIRNNFLFRVLTKILWSLHVDILTV